MRGADDPHDIGIGDQLDGAVTVVNSDSSLPVSGFVQSTGPGKSPRLEEAPGHPLRIAGAGALPHISPAGL